MKRVFDFVESLKPDVFDLLGYPTIHLAKDVVEIYFDTSNVIRNFSFLALLEKGCDEFRMFGNHSAVLDCEVITIVCKFYDLPFEE